MKKSLSITYDNYKSSIMRACSEQEKERKRIARELHDETIQQLAVMGMAIDAILNYDDSLPSHIRTQLQGLRDTTDNILVGVRRICHNLRPPLMYHTGLADALRWMVTNDSVPDKINCSFVLEGTEKRLAPDVEMLLFRIVQEAMTNVTKHARARNLEVVISYDTQSLNLIIADDGIGIDATATLTRMSRTAALGLIGMKERAMLLGADLTIKSLPKKGTRINVEVPIHQHDGDGLVPQYFGERIL